MTFGWIWGLNCGLAAAWLSTGHVRLAWWNLAAAGFMGLSFLALRMWRGGIQ